MTRNLTTGINFGALVIPQPLIGQAGVVQDLALTVPRPPVSRQIAAGSW